MDLTTEQELKLLVANAPMGICILDAHTLKAEICNDTFTAVAGRSRDTIIGSFYWDTFSEVRRHYEEALAAVVSKGEPYHADEAELSLIKMVKQKLSM